MATIPQFYGDFTFSGDSSQFLNNLNGLDDEPSVAFPDSNSMLSNCPTGFDDYYGALNMHRADISQASVTPLPESFGISFMSPPEYKNNFNGNKIGVCGHVNATQYFYNGEECRDSSPDQLKPFFCPTTRDHENWGTREGGKQIPATEETDSKVRKYSLEERKDRIMRYLKKKNQRNFNKTIKYACRKTLADRRARIRGRFARKNETREPPPTSSINNMDTKKEEEMYWGSQIEHDDRWLQEAMSDFMHLPYDTYVADTWSL